MSKTARISSPRCSSSSWGTDIAGCLLVHVYDSVSAVSNARRYAQVPARHPTATPPMEALRATGCQW
ncbi:hypothetical protein GCM10010236_19000 [Streptomyces eurythermus]|nr:hypothetical protein GCM10010236_19000 [Streptomyces eurythermus]